MESEIMNVKSKLFCSYTVWPDQVTKSSFTSSSQNVNVSVCVYVYIKQLLVP